MSFTDNQKYKFSEMIIYLIIFKTTIELIYIFGISESYSYDGLTLEINLVKSIISLILTFILVFLSPKDKQRPSTYIYIIMLYFIYVPFISYFWLNDQSITYAMYLWFCMLIISLILKIKPRYLSFEKYPSSVLLKSIFYVFLLLNIFLIFERGGIDSRAFDFDTVYDLRSENNITGLLGYIVNWCAKSFFPFFFIYFYYKKKIPISVLLISLQVLLYLSFGNKAFLFSIGVVFISALFIQKRIFNKGMGLFLAILNIFAYVLNTTNITDSLFRAIPYRMLFIPSQIQFQYYEYFNSREKVLYSEGFIGKILNIDNALQNPVPLIISRYFLGRDSFSNTGLFSDAYYNAGIIGMIIVSVIFTVLLLIIDSTTLYVPIYIVVGSLSYIMFVLNDTGLQTTLLTGGLAINIILLQLLNSSMKSHRNHIENLH